MAGLYKGMALPFGNTLSSYVDPKNDREVLRTSIQIILETKIGERPMLPGFGSPLHEAAFEPGDDQLTDALVGIVKENVPFWDARLEVLDVSVSSHEISKNEVTVSVVYRDLAVPDSEDRFVFNIPSEVISRIGQ